jgi:hypothetical protein
MLKYVRSLLQFVDGLTEAGFTNFVAAYDEVGRRIEREWFEQGEGSHQ